LIEQFGGELGRTQLQKLLFLYGQQNDDQVYEFIPYKYGCYSFQAYADKQKLTKQGLLTDSERWQLATCSETTYRSQLKHPECRGLWQLHKQFGNHSRDDLIRYVYATHPYYATRSVVAETLLSPEQLACVRAAEPRVQGTCICSIGYEGLSLENYLNRLIRHGVRMVCDVRKNPLSRKFGFSKATLTHALENLNIEYRHFSQLGIVSDKRCQLKTQADYDALFDDYEKTTLPAEQAAIKTIAKLLEEQERIALICFEKFPQQCHRTRVLNAVLAESTKRIPVYGE
jgi:uncharacterized protein (DUF488 family)